MNYYINDKGHRDGGSLTLPLMLYGLADQLVIHSFVAQLHPIMLSTCNRALGIQTVPVPVPKAIPIHAARSAQAPCRAGLPRWESTISA